jgi:hypothetical protein
MRPEPNRLAVVDVEGFPAFTLIWDVAIWLSRPKSVMGKVVIAAGRLLRAEKTEAK